MVASVENADTTLYFLTEEIIFGKSKEVGVKPRPGKPNPRHPQRRRSWFYHLALAMSEVSRGRKTMWSANHPRNHLWPYLTGVKNRKGWSWSAPNPNLYLPLQLLLRDSSLEEEDTIPPKAEGNANYPVLQRTRGSDSFSVPPRSEGCTSFPLPPRMQGSDIYPVLPKTQGSVSYPIPLRMQGSASYPVPPRMQGTDSYPVPPRTQDSASFPLPLRMQGGSSFPVPPRIQGSASFPVPPRIQGSASFPVPPRIQGSASFPVPPRMQGSASFPVPPRTQGNANFHVPPRMQGSVSFPVLPRTQDSASFPVTPRIQDNACYPVPPSMQDSLSFPASPRTQDSVSYPVSPRIQGSISYPIPSGPQGSVSYPAPPRPQDNISYPVPPRPMDSASYPEPSKPPDGVSYPLPQRPQDSISYTVPPRPLDNVSYPVPPRTESNNSYPVSSPYTMPEMLGYGHCSGYRSRGRNVHNLVPIKKEEPILNEDTAVFKNDSQYCKQTSDVKSPLIQYCEPATDEKSIIKTENFLQEDISVKNVKMETAEDTASDDMHDCSFSDQANGRPFIKEEFADRGEFVLEDSFLKTSIGEAVCVQNVQLEEDLKPKDDVRRQEEETKVQTGVLDQLSDENLNQTKHTGGKDGAVIRRESKKCRIQRLFGKTDSPPRRSKVFRTRTKIIKCKSCRLGRNDVKDLLKPRPLNQEIATCSYVMLDELVDECPLGHLLDPSIASINLKSGLVTVYCSKCDVTVYMKNSIIPKVK
ncbi:uncharacterized protein LOC125039350 [Penaeus chinensis]|uniref:uncharacterized protein LOC125039350 n=1 Tax=Penaeus chinensis TaxID=139456 RepID=UPI001FB5B443|nr:uncharacterized protein LOC125039350 [Penaeus chinensis]